MHVAKLRVPGASETVVKEILSVAVRDVCPTGGNAKWGKIRTYTLDGATISYFHEIDF